MYCQKCGAPITSSGQFCSKCGARISAPSAPANYPAVSSGNPTLAAKPKPKGMHGCLIALIVGVCLVALFAVLTVAAALIWGPKLLSAVGLGPKDLGVTWTAQDYKNFMNTVDVETGTPPESTDRSAFRKEFIGTKDVDWTLSEKEMTAWTNYNRPGYWPFSNVQVKFHDNNVIEASSFINLQKLFSYPVLKADLSADDLRELERIPVSIPVYIKAHVRLTSSKTVAVDVQDIRIAGFEITQDMLGYDENDLLGSVFNDMIAMADQVSITELATSEGKLHLVGTWYEEMKRIPND